MRYLIFDSETTGFKKGDQYPRLVQLAWIVADEHGQELSKKDFIIIPNGFEIPDKAASIHGIDTEFAKKYGVPLETAIEAFISDLETCECIVGHGLNYDIGVVGFEAEKLVGKNIFAGLGRRDTMTENKNVFGKWQKLEALYEQCFGKCFENAHKAFADVKATKEIFFHLEGNHA